MIETTIPFNSVRKRMTVAIRPSANDEHVIVTVKGAPEYVMHNCTHILNKHGEVEQLQETERNRIFE